MCWPHPEGKRGGRPIGRAAFHNGAQQPFVWYSQVDIVLGETPEQRHSKLWVEAADPSKIRALSGEVWPLLNAPAGAHLWLYIPPHFGTVVVQVNWKIQ